MKQITTVAALSIFAVGGATALLAQDVPPKVADQAKATAIHKERTSYMGMLSDNEKILVAVMKSQGKPDAKAVAAAEKIHGATSPKELTSHFNPGTGDDIVQGSRARASIWTEWDKFTQLASAVQPAAAKTLAAAKAGDPATFAEAEQATVNACNACHKVYRAPRR